MKRVLLLVGARNKRENHLGALMELWRSRSEVACEDSSLEELVFATSGYAVKISTESGDDIAGYDLVVFRTVGTYKKEAVAVAKYCQERGVKYIDSMIHTVGAVDDENKLAEIIVLCMEGIPVPDTFYGSWEHSDKWMLTTEYPLVLKAIDGKKGRNNYFAESVGALEGILHEAGDMRMLVQRYIPNNEDYRVLVLGYKDVVVTKRVRRDKNTHLNNVSLGGEEILVQDYTGLELVIDVAIRAAKILAIEIAGVDVVVDKDTGLPYVMEVNRAPELTLDDELTAYAKAIVDMAYIEETT